MVTAAATCVAVICTVVAAAAAATSAHHLGWPFPSAVHMSTAAGKVPAALNRQNMTHMNLPVQSTKRLQHKQLLRTPTIAL